MCVGVYPTQISDPAQMLKIFNEYVIKKITYGEHKILLSDPLINDDKGSLYYLIRYDEFTLQIIPR